jgi:hypothetical protein
VTQYDLEIRLMARAICAADGVDPDKECCGLGQTMPYGLIYPAWKARVRQAEECYNCVVSMGFPPACHTPSE